MSLQLRYVTVTSNSFPVDLQLLLPGVLVLSWIVLSGVASGSNLKCVSCSLVGGVCQNSPKNQLPSSRALFGQCDYVFRRKRHGSMYGGCYDFYCQTMAHMGSHMDPKFCSKAFYASLFVAPFLCFRPSHQSREILVAGLGLP